MKASMNWIREYADIPVSAETYQQKMVMAGTGIESVSDLAPMSGVVAGRVVRCEKHPDSDHLHVCQVDAGQGSLLQIVCGAPNVAEGQLVPTALIGAKLPNGMTIKKGKIRGVESMGMLCSAAELMIPQDLYPSKGEAGLLILMEEYLPGSDIREILHLNDTVVDFEILANRPDCLSIRGVARETAAVFSVPFRQSDIHISHAGGNIHEYVRVSVENSAGCPRYMARVIRNARPVPSPLWLRTRLYAAGIRSINNIVDITNYVMLETGHPMHAFDLSRVNGRHIIVRDAKPREVLTTLDGKTHVLSGGELLICDEAGPTGLAGIMGGLESEITPDTCEILFECAAFDRALTRIVSRRLGIRTESSGRFERGVNPATVGQAMDRACQLVNLLDAGDVVDGVIDLYPNPEAPKALTVSVMRIAHRAGTDIGGEEMAEILKRLDFDVELIGDELKVTPPIQRQDITNEADICEEVLRLAGYERIPETLLRGETTPGHDSASGILKRRLQDLLSGLGYDEIINYSFTGQKQLELLGLNEQDERLDPIAIRNPLGEDTAVMRTTMASDMLRVLSRNMNQRNAVAWLYEFGTLYDKHQRTEEGLFAENQSLCLGAYGDRADFYTVRDAVLTLLNQTSLSWDIQAGGEAYHHPGRCAVILIQGKRIATIGEVHPETAERFELTERAVIAEVDLGMLSRLAKPFDRVKPIPRTPAVTRDLALVLDEGQPLLPVQQAIEKAAGTLLEDVALFDVFRGKQLGEGKKSAAFSLTLRHPDKTLEEAEINAVIQKIINRLKDDFQAEVRS